MPAALPFFVPTANYFYPMRKKSTCGLLFIASGIALMALASSCAVKRGCPATQSGMGAERVLAGEKVKKQKFKIKGMN
jgi:hypothetical protein